MSIQVEAQLRFGVQSTSLSDWTDDVWFLEPSLKARVGRIKGADGAEEKQPIEGLPATWRYGSGVMYAAEAWKPYILGLTQLLHPQLSAAAVLDACDSVYRRNGGWSNGHGWDEDFKIAPLDSESNMVRSVIMGPVLVMKNFGGETFAAVRAMDVHRPRPAPMLLTEIQRWEHFVPTTCRTGGCGLFPKVDGRLLLPLFGEVEPDSGFEFPIQWLKVRYDDAAEGDVGNGMRKIAAPIDPGVPMRPDAVAGVPWAR